MAFDLTGFVGLPRLKALHVSPQGRLVAEVDELSNDGKKYVSSLRELDPAGVLPARRLTRSEQGESGAAFGADGSLYFRSKRPGGDTAEEDTAALWVLPPGGGEARRIASRPGGITGVSAAREADVLIVSAPTLSAGPAAEEEQRNARKDADVAAILFEEIPVRYWDHDLGPGAPRLFLGTGAAAEDAPIDLRDLTPDAGRALDEQHFTLTPDGRTVVTGWNVPDEPGHPRGQVVAIDTVTGEWRVLAGDAQHVYGDPAVSPDGDGVACLRTRDGSFEEPPDTTLWLHDLRTGEGRDLTPDLDLWPTGLAWAADSAAVYFTADQTGRAPLFRVDLPSGEVTRLSADGQYDWICPDPDGTAVYALRSRIDAPPTPVRLDPKAPDQEGVALPAPGGVDVPGRVEEVTGAAADGTALRAWLVLPSAAEAAPAPLLLWMHGGPLGSWHSWSWRWNPWLMAARGYAVLLPDPALSTGYGLDFIRRGWGQWGGTPYTDLMAMTDIVTARPDIDAGRTAAMGGSYGGYLANWVAGHTDRFRCIVTHASLWALDQFQGTTDHPAYWAREWGLPDDHPERYEAWSPHHYADAIRTPMLVIHGDKDYRVPFGEALRLWWDLQRRGVESKFLYFPDENHWILKPGNATVWYETVFAWLATHVLEEKWERPDLL